MNNLLCFPFIFKGALDVGATAINEEMKIACVRALADLAMQESPEVVARPYGGEELAFGPEYLIPKPFDPRLLVELAPAVARAAMDSGVATRPIRVRIFPTALLKGAANLLIMPNLDAANAAFNLAKVLAKTGYLSSPLAGGTNT